MKFWPEKYPYAKFVLFVLLILVAMGQTANLRVQNLNNIRYCNEFTGANASAKILACIAALPATGGVADARGMEGAQATTTTITANKPVNLLLGATTLTIGANPGFSGTISIDGLGSSITTISVPTVGKDGIIATAGQHYRGFKLSGPNTASDGFIGIDGDADDIEIAYTIIENWGGHCINTAGNSERWSVHHNIIRGCFQDGILVGPAIDDNGRAKNIIESNQFLNIAYNCVDINGSNNIIKGNQFTGCGQPGGSVDRNAILIQAVQGYGVDANYNTITGNSMSTTAAACISIRGDTGRLASHNIITDNECVGSTSVSGTNGDGVLLDGSIAGTVSFNVISNNRIIGCQRYGLGADATVGANANNTFSMNTVTGCAYNFIVGSGVTDLQANMNTFLAATTTNIVDAGTRTSININKETNADSNVRFYQSVGFGGATLAIGTNPALTGTLRLPNNGIIYHRNAANNADLATLWIDNSNQTTLRGGGGAKTVLIQTSIGSEIASFNNTSLNGAWAGSQIMADGRYFKMGGFAFADLPTPPDGSIVYCSNCNKATPCTSGGGGAIAKYVAGAWDCD